MANGIASNLPNSKPTHTRPAVRSYDSGYEFSFERYVDVNLLVRSADRESSDAPATLAFAY
jgi:hypothetical protein